MLTVSQAAALLGLSRSAVLAMLRVGTLPGARKVPAHAQRDVWAIPEDAVQKARTSRPGKGRPRKVPV
jgi:excisionase family DNA binding protein